jgi:transposase
MTYSIDLRMKVMQFLKKRHTVKEAAEAFGIAERTIGCWIRKEKDGNLAAKKRKKGAYKLNEEELKKYIAEHPDAYLREIAAVFKTTLYAIFYACKRLKITLKKNDFLQGKRRGQKRTIS